ncbi:MAG: ketopantoate reductase family protein [Spirochaetota bacterium]
MLTTIHNVAIIGAGAVGATYGSILYEKSTASVSFLAEGQRLERLQQGLVVNNKSYHVHVRKPGAFDSPPQLIIAAVKYHHLEQAIRDIEPEVTDQTQILSLLNGIDSEEKIARAYGWDHVLYGVSLGIDAVREKDKVVFSSPGTLYIGRKKNNPPEEIVQNVASLLSNADLPCVVPSDMLRILWWKYMINAGINQASAVLNAPYEVFQKQREALDMVDAAMEEVVQIADKEGVHLGEDLFEQWYKVLKTLDPKNKTSMLQDVQAQRKTEVEMFAGKIIDLGEKHNIPTPVNRIFMDIIRCKEHSYGF